MITALDSSTAMPAMDLDLFIVVGRTLTQQAGAPCQRRPPRQPRPASAHFLYMWRNGPPGEVPAGWATIRRMPRIPALTLLGVCLGTVLTASAVQAAKPDEVVDDGLVRVEHSL